MQFVQSRNIALLAFLMLASSGASRGNEPPAPTVVMLFGDSITVGYNEHVNFFGLNGAGTNNIDNDPANLGAPTIETAAILNDSMPTRTSVVVNWGVGGSNTAQGAARISSNLAQTKLAHSGKAYIALIMYGTNDFDFGISASTTKFNIAEMIKDADDMGFIPVLGTLTPRSDRNETVISYNDEIKQAPAMSGRGPITIVDQYSLIAAQGIPCGNSLFTPEPAIGNVCLHPNSAGYKKIAENWFNQALMQLIEPDPVETVITVAPIINLLLDD